MRVIELKAENLKRLRAVDITPTSDLVIIAGRNASGKTTCLDAISWAIGGAAMFRDQPDPVRHGEKRAEVTVDLGELTVTRSWTADGKTKLTVRNAQGIEPKSPQALLDSLIGTLSFDPLAFANTDPKSQRRTLLGLVELPFDLDEIDRRRAEIFDERTTANRDHKTLANALSLLDEPKPLGAPAVSMADAVAALTAATSVARANDEVRRAYEAAEDRLADAVQARDAAESALQRAESEMQRCSTSLAEAIAAVQALPPDPDVDELAAAVADADKRKDAERLAGEYHDRECQVLDAKAAADHLTELLEQIDAEKLAGLQSAVMPIDGLAISDDGVLFQGVPFTQASGAERLKVSLAIGMAANPKLRVLIIRDGSLLDEDSLQVVREMAGEHDYQIWCEVVDSSGDVGIVIEDGSVVAINEESAP